MSWHLALLRSVPRNARVDSHPDGGLILSHHRLSRVPAEPDLFADDDDLTSVAGEAVSLRVHTAAVVAAAQKVASRCLPTEFLRPLQLAAQWHDVGKLDERFQFLLRRGDEIAVATGDPIARDRVRSLGPVQAPEENLSWGFRPMTARSGSNLLPRQPPFVPFDRIAMQGSLWGKNSYKRRSILATRLV